MKKRVVIYTDGACDPNPGPGGWAAILRYARHEKVISGGNPQTTNNRMELQAALSALKALKQSCSVILNTDSEYLRRGIKEWLPAWQRRGWHTGDRRPVQNQDLWQALATEVERHQVEWRWVRGHAGDPLNERVDRLARSAIPRPPGANARGLSAPGQAKDAIQMFTRASCMGSPGPGGWAVVVRRGDELTSLTGGKVETTANEMELQAAIQGLASLTEPSRVHMHTVSKYVHLGITRWVPGWEARGWQKKNGQPVRHKRLWLALKEAANGHQVEWHQPSAEDRPPESEQAAVLASAAAHAMQEQAQNQEAQAARD